MQHREELESYFAVELGTERDVIGWTEAWTMEEPGRLQRRPGVIDLFGNSRSGGIFFRHTVPTQYSISQKHLIYLCFHP
jgi:hypothetical protein